MRMHVHSLVLLLLCAHLSHGMWFMKRSDNTNCGYKSCPAGKPGMINVHLVPHTHDDAGWLKTVDQYFYGANNSIQNARVQYILDSVIPQLQADPNKRFIYVEMAFFTRWYDQLHDIYRHTVKKLVNDGQLEFVGGGWVMNDEATPHYSAIIDQMSVGFKYLHDVFGQCGRPRVAWQIDPFGHSREQASLFAQMGFDGLFFGRIDYDDKKQREKQKTLEHIWAGSPRNLGEKSNLFTGTLFSGYGPPSGFCFDIGCDDPPIMDDPRMNGYNVNERVESFLKAVQDQASHYTTSNVMLTMGSDFNYQSANHWYKNLDKLIYYVNARQSNGSKVNVFYSTPSCYLYSVNKADKQWTVKTDDYFPYASGPRAYWTGFYTSRPALKYYVQQTNNFLQVCKQLDTLAKLGPLDRDDLTVLKKDLALTQHHDAVSGTEKQHVAFDYAQRLDHGISECEDAVDDAYRKLMRKSDNPTAELPRQRFCPLLNVSVCNNTELSNSFMMTVYNPVAHNVTTYQRVPVVGNKYRLVASDGKTDIAVQMVPVTKMTKAIPGRGNSTADFEMVFPVTLPALGWNTVFATKLHQDEPATPTHRYRRSNADVQIANEYVSLIFDGTSGLLKSVTNLKDKIQLPVQQSFYYYKAAGPSLKKSQPSGAYVFRPNGSQPEHLGSKATIIGVVKGDHVQEVHQVFSPWLSQVVRLYNGTRHAHFEWTVGPIPVDDLIGKEIISRFDSKIKSSGLYYTDANGREVLQRKRNFRPTWNLNVTEPVSGNYYPVNGRVFINDTSSGEQLTILTDRAQGVASLQDGSLELMVHRRLLHDDGFGVGEPLNETGISGRGLVARGTHLLVVAPSTGSARIHRELSYHRYMNVWPSFAPTPTFAPETWVRDLNTVFSGLKRSLPRNVNILTLEQWQGTSVLLRLEHIYEAGEDPELSQPVKVALTGLFSPFEVLGAEEMVLGANLPLQDEERLKWKTSGENVSAAPQYVPLDEALAVELRPMEIRTFVLTLQQ